MSNILLFGKSGMLGSYFDKYLSKNHKVISIDRTIINATNVDILKLKELISSCDVVVNCYGLIKQRDVSDEDMINVNSIFPNTLSAMCLVFDKKFIHITTDCVYDGSSGSYNEETPPSSCDMYGKSKFLGEPKYGTIIRTSILGEEKYNKKSLLEWVLAQNSDIIGYTNHYWNGVTCLELAKVVASIIETGSYWNGVRILNTNKINKHNIVTMICDVYNKKNNIIPKEVVACDRSMKSLFEYPNNLVTKNIKEQIEEMKGWIYM